MCMCILSFFFLHIINFFPITTSGALKRCSRCITNAQTRGDQSSREFVFSSTRIEVLSSFHAADTDSYSAVPVEPLPFRISRYVISFRLIHSAHNQIEILECAIERTVAFLSSYIYWNKCWKILQVKISINVFATIFLMQKYSDLSKWDKLENVSFKQLDVKFIN